VVGNPVRPSVLTGSREEAQRLFGLEDGLPVLLVTGGGTGALGLNQIVHEAAPELVNSCQIIHLTGAGKAIGGWAHPRYHVYEFISDEMKHALAVADVVVSRSGMSALAEIGALGKASIIVPMPASHQEANAAAFASSGAAITFDERRLTPDTLRKTVKELLADSRGRRELGTAAQQMLPVDAADALVREILALLR
jgi:UDP-N-acetylglucosamine--N-acetylmuramyl-(pentapeptide) pyrophosphoryl-undecaprenol N-acetylglucosamine transferase